MLTRASVAHYLVSRGWLDSKALVVGGLMVAETSRRNTNFKVLADGGGFFLKHPKDPDPHGRHSLHREAEWYTLVRTTEGGLASMMPTLLDYDQQEEVLLLELVPNSESLGQLHTRTNSFPLQLATELGRLLARYHEAAQQVAIPSSFPRKPPWVLTAHLVHESLYRDNSRANAKLLEIVRDPEQFAGPLEELRAQWQPSSLIHGDLKWDNVLVHWPTPDRPELKLIDWEMVDAGDPLWDVGSVVHAYVSYWLLSLGRVDEAGQEISAVAGRSFGAAQAPVAALLTAYIEARTSDSRQAQEFIRMTLRYAAARMIQTAYECMHASDRLTPQVVYLLQLSLNMLRRPDEAARSLLNL